MSLRLVSKETTRIEIGDEDWIEVHVDISRRTFNNLLATLPITREGLDADDVDVQTASAFSEALFVAFVTDWSVVDDKGKAVKPTLENYQNLSRESSSLIDSAITEHFNSLTPDAQESTKSEGPSEE